MTASLAAAVALCLLAAPAPTPTAEAPEQLVDKLVRWAPPRDYPRDKANPYHRPLVALGPKAVPALLAALVNPAAPYPERRTAIVWLLGEIGDPRAFEPLLRLWEAAKEPGEKWRTGLCLGASLDAANVARLFARLEPATGLPLLADLTGQKLPDLAQYRAWLSVPANLAATVDSCRKRNVPQLG